MIDNVTDEDLIVAAEFYDSLAAGTAYPPGSVFIGEPMTEEQLEKKGYYLFGIDQDRFVQVRDLKTDKIILMGQGREQALKKAERYFAEYEEAK